MMPGVAAGLLFTLSRAPCADAQIGQTAQTPADYVNPLIDAHKSRWVYFSSACRPFGMDTVAGKSYPLLLAQKVDPRSVRSMGRMGKNPPLQSLNKTQSKGNIL